MKLNKKIASIGVMIACATGALIATQSAVANAGKGMRTIYYSDASKTNEVGFTMNRRGCGGGSITFGQVTSYRTVNSFVCSNWETYE